MRALVVGGVNRVSIGVQDYHPEVQKAVIRIHPFEVTQRLIDEDILPGAAERWR